MVLYFHTCIRMLSAKYGFVQSMDYDLLTYTYVSIAHASLIRA